MTPKMSAAGATGSAAVHLPKQKTSCSKAKPAVTAPVCMLRPRKRGRGEGNQLFKVRTGLCGHKFLH